MQNHVFFFNTHLSCFFVFLFLIWCRYSSFVIMEHDALSHLGTHLTEVFFPVNISLWGCTEARFCVPWWQMVDVSEWTREVGELLRCRVFCTTRDQAKDKASSLRLCNALVNVQRSRRPTYIEILCVRAHTSVWINAPVVFAAIPMCIYLYAIVSVYAVSRPYTNLTCSSANTHTLIHNPPPTTLRPLSLTYTHWLATAEARHKLFPSNRVLVNQ